MYFCNSCSKKVPDDHKCVHANPDDLCRKPKSIRVPSAPVVEEVVEEAPVIEEKVVEPAPKKPKRKPRKKKA